MGSQRRTVHEACNQRESSSAQGRLGCGETSHLHPASPTPPRDQNLWEEGGPVRQPRRPPGGTVGSRSPWSIRRLSKGSRKLIILGSGGAVTEGAPSEDVKGTEPGLEVGPRRQSWDHSVPLLLHPQLDRKWQLQNQGLPTCPTTGALPFSCSQRR